MTVKVPVIWGTDAVHGHNNVYGATLFPHNIGLGAAHDPALLTRIGHATARAVRATGITWVFAPAVAVAQNPRWGRTYESYSSDPALVRSYAEAIIRGPARRPRQLDDDVLATPEALDRRRRHVPRQRAGRDPRPPKPTSPGPTPPASMARSRPTCRR